MGPRAAELLCANRMQLSERRDVANRLQGDDKSGRDRCGEGLEFSLSLL